MNLGFTSIKSVTEISIPIPKNFEEPRCLFVLDLDDTLINLEGSLRNPGIVQWINLILDYHDILICTYRDMTSFSTTEEQLRTLGLGRILDQNSYPGGFMFGSGLLYHNVFYSKNKGHSIFEYRVFLYPKQWVMIYFADDQPGAILEVKTYNPEVIAYLVY